MSLFRPGMRAFSTIKPVLAEAAKTGSAQAAAPVEAAAPRSTVKNIDSRKTYLMDVYKYFWENNQIVLFAHHNNMVAQENEKVRRQLHKVDKSIQYRKLKTTIFRHFLRASEHPDPASKSAARMVQRKHIRHPLEPLLNGPTAAILIKDLDPTAVKGVFKVLAAEHEKLFLIGAKVGDDVLDLEGITKFKELPSLQDLRAQLLGMLTMASGAGVVKTLQAAPSVLAMTLEGRKQQLDDEKKD